MKIGNNWTNIRHVCRWTECIGILTQISTFEANLFAFSTKRRTLSTLAMCEEEPLWIRVTERILGVPIWVSSPVDTVLRLLGAFLNIFLLRKMQPITTVAPKSKVALNEVLLCMIVQWLDDFDEIDLNDGNADGCWGQLTSERLATHSLGRGN